MDQKTDQPSVSKNSSPSSLQKFLSQFFSINQKSQQKHVYENHTQIIAPTRPLEILKEIGKVYMQLTQQIHPKFGFAKTLDYYFSFLDISGLDLVLKYYNIVNKAQINLLHIGTGDITFAKKLKEVLGDRIIITVLAPTEHTQRKEEQDNGDINYIIGNAEYLFTLFPTNTFDIILSAEVFSNFVDPFGTIQQVYQALLPGGVMLIDDFQLLNIQDQLPNIVEFLNKNEYLLVTDYIFSIQNNDVVIDGIRCFMAKKTLPQLTVPGITYTGIREDTNPLTSNHATYAINPAFSSFKKQLSLETEAFLHLIQSLIPDLSEQDIVQSLLNPQILNNKLTNVKPDAYAIALQTTFTHLLKTHSISVSEALVQQAIPMTVYIGKWMDELRNREEFLMRIRDRIGIAFTET